MKLIGISGKKQSGKDTVADLLVQSFPTLCTGRIAFASALKKEVCDVCKISPALLEKHKEQFRTMLQWWGTEFRRNFYGDDYWLKRMLEALKEFEPMCSYVFIPDVRFPNELYFVKQHGGFVIRVNRPTESIVDSHPSEIALDNQQQFDCVLDNSGTIQDLLKQIQEKVIPQII